MVEALIVQLKQGTLQERLTAALALGIVKDENALEALHQALLDNKNNSDLRRCILQSLRQFNNPSSILFIISCLDELPTGHTLSLAVNILGGFGQPAFAPTLAALNNENLRHGAVLASGKLKAKAAFEPLLRILTDKTENMATRLEAAHALAGINAQRVLPVFRLLLRQPLEDIPLNKFFKQVLLTYVTERETPL